jgi:hypothetical protein
MTTFLADSLTVLINQRFLGRRFGADVVVDEVDDVCLGGIVVEEDCVDERLSESLGDFAFGLFLDQLVNGVLGLLGVLLLDECGEDVPESALDLFLKVFEVFVNFVLQDLLNSHGRKQRHRCLCRHRS